MLLFIYWYANNNDANKLELSVIMHAQDGRKAWLQDASSNNSTGGRTISLASGEITFGASTYGNSQNNAYLIPLYIYGIKGVNNGST